MGQVIMNGERRHNLGTHSDYRYFQFLQKTAPILSKSVYLLQLLLAFEMVSRSIIL